MVVKKKVKLKESNNVKEIIKGVIDQLKPELDKKIESLRSDINADMTERLERIQVPTPAVAPGGGMDLNSVMKSLQGNNGQIDMGAIGKMMGQMPAQTPPGMDISKMDPEMQMKFHQSQQQNQLMMVILPELLKSNQGASPMMAEMMQRFFMENMLDGMNQRKAFTTFAMKLAGDPKLMESYQNSQANVVTPVTDALSNTLNKPMGVPGATADATKG